MQLHDLVATSHHVVETPSRLAKVSHLAALLRRAAPDEISIAIAYLTGRLPQGRIGVGYAAVRDAMPDSQRTDEPRISLREVDAAFARIATVSGKGSATEKGQLLHGLLEQATVDERHFLVRLIMGELRQGALEGLMVEAVARAVEAPADAIRRAVTTTGDLATVARAVLVEGRSALARFAIRLLHPIKPMLAQPADDPAAAVTQLGEAALEYKMDGARIQIHKAGDEVKVFSRTLRDVTASVPEVVAAARSLSLREAILDGEVLALESTGRPHPFQVTMSRFGRRLDVEAMRHELPLSAFLFDLLYADGQPLIDEPQSARMTLMSESLPPELIVPRTVTADGDAARAFLAQALAHGHEGMMAKRLDAPYEAGSRGAAWLKVKPAHALDLVVLAAEWGHGRRHGRLSNLHLGARDPESGGFVMLGKTFKGMTDAMLVWQTEQLLSLEAGRDGHVVYVRPSLVVEVAFNDIQASSHYPAGMALRFARVKRYRADKSASEADTIATVQEIFEAGRRES